MALSWNEIKDRAVAFSKEWENETREHAEAKSFWDAFFNVFGMPRRRLATFEEPVKLLKNKRGFIDLFWKSNLLVEHKSAGEDLDAAYAQATDYFEGIKDRDLPKYILVSDFKKFRLYDLETKKHTEFPLGELAKNAKLFGFIAGYSKQEYKPEDPVNIKAAEKLGALYESISESGYGGHELKMFLVRILFCLFADDSTIFNAGTFRYYIENKTNVDGTDLAGHLTVLFQTLDTPLDKRPKTLDEDLVSFQYVNGSLFKENLPLPSFNRDMREKLLDAAAFDWSKISPAIFGSMFQSVMDKKARRELGAHYTSETNILKLIKPLFLDELKEELDSCGKHLQKLEAFQNKIASLKFLDPACGCGNFLIISYRELRLLELEMLKLRYGVGGTMLPFDVKNLIKVRPEQFYGIEIEEFPARIAQTAIWLMDHQMNEIVSTTFGKNYARLPLTDGAKIVIGNALTIEWQMVVPKNELSYILGNPPFIGSKLMDANQREELEAAFDHAKGVGVLDYVTAWYIKATKYIQGTQIKVAFVSTNSITQGEQVGILWNELLNKYGIKIHFAHRTFKWTNEARGKAGVYCVIIGFGNFDIEKKMLYEYEDIRGEAHEIEVKNINPYLVVADDVVILSRQKPISDIPEMSFGNMPLDGGHLLLSDEEKKRINPKRTRSIKVHKTVNQWEGIFK
jgi:type II restriction/modification system DNA methylase subunit YeeA